ncbi:Chloride transport protein 6 [Anabarilius grahami]|uniref:Chloride channel protein n=1 Tax=Anabarilius grahami TaxID=495550 RepID=A0A3N0YT05_ANAGA|nr:Chloride transport protein 6 [Anabarilius grahami]
MSYEMIVEIQGGACARALAKQRVRRLRTAWKTKRVVLCGVLLKMACCGGCLCCQCCCNEGETRTPEELTILGETREDDDEILPRKDYESLDYDRCINEPFLEVLEGLDNKKAKKYEAIKWILVFAIGVSTGLTGLFVDFFVRLFTQLKFSLVGQSVEECSENGCLALSLLELLALNMMFIFISSVLVLIEPVAAGSGIPEIKSYLNGVKIPGIVRLRTFICKVTGVLFAVAGGLFVGKEGPMIHSGAIVGAGLPQFQSITFKKILFHFPYFRSDRDKRDFVSAGAAAGVAAAFGAPIGGTLFSLEEGSSFWNQALTWKVLFCSMSATFTLNFFRSGINFSKWGSFQLPGLLNFGEFKCTDGDKSCHLWTAVDLAFFVLMGVAGGLLGALFNCINKRLAKYRMRNVHPKARFVRVLESLLVCMVTSLVIFIASVTLGECRDLVSTTNNNTSTQGSVNEEVNSTIRRFFCFNNTYNDMATLFFNPQEVAIHQLFHQNATFSPVTLSLFFVLYFFLSCWTYGVSVPSGLFVPSLLCGASLGRLVANILKINFHMQIYAGTFALIGAAAFLGGVVRMTISLTVILIESTNEITYGLPIMITLMVAKWTGDFFNEGIYDIHIHLKGVPLLEWETEVEMDKLTASDIMEPNLTYVYPHTRIQSLVSILRTTVYHAFPVVTENRDNEKEFMKGNILISNNIKFKKTSVLTRAGEQRRRCQSMKSYPSSELRNVCDEQVVVEPAEEGQDILQQMLERRYVPYPNLYPDQSPSEEWTMEERFRPLTFHGLILRSQLVNLLIRGVCYAENQSSASQPRLSHSEMTEDYPRFPDIHDLDLALLNPRMIVDVTPYMNPSPYTVSPNTRVSQVFNLFRTMGLRHLPVVNAEGEFHPVEDRIHHAGMDGLLRNCATGCRVDEAFTMDDLVDSISADTSGLRCGHVQLRIVFITPIVGIITRHNLTHEFLVAKLRQHYITI